MGNIILKKNYNNILICASDKNYTNSFYSCTLINKILKKTDAKGF